MQQNTNQHAMESETAWTHPRPHPYPLLSPKEPGQN